MLTRVARYSSGAQSNGNLFSIINEVFDSVNTERHFIMSTVYILGYILASSNKNCLQLGQ